MLLFRSVKKRERERKNAYCFVVLDERDLLAAVLEYGGRIGVPVDVVYLVRFVVVRGHHDFCDEIGQAFLSEAHLVVRILKLHSHILVYGALVQQLVRELGTQEQFFAVVGADRRAEAVYELEIVFADEDAIF